ncbi:hypothetical protein BS78_K181500 [Paspalum vaginatum]|uniref:CCHC-type domain-containing protein n=1 Tax=Paspalum vaginatum TaxID=158149 RepID=A0A9W7XBR0_9POAL|nr:hypothetical protein BS78_K181500 [Paspalum vaginatum]
MCREGWNYDWKGAYDAETGEPLCYKCGLPGHQRAQCTNPPKCYNSQDSGHVSSNCPKLRKNRGLRLCAMGMPGQLFYSMQVPLEEDEAKKDEPITAVMRITSGVGTVETVTTELRYQISSTWNWQVRKIAPKEFLFVVPSIKDQVLTKFPEFQCKTHDLKAWVEKSHLAVGSFGELETTWVQVQGVAP